MNEFIFMIITTHSVHVWRSHYNSMLIVSNYDIAHAIYISLYSDDNFFSVLLPDDKPGKNSTLIRSLTLQSDIEVQVKACNHSVAWAFGFSHHTTANATQNASESR